MLNRFRNSIRTQLFVIALSLIVVTAVLNITAYLTDVKTLEYEFILANGDDFGISFTGKSYEDNNIITPGQDITINPTVKNSGKYDVYVFVTIDIPSVFSINDLNESERQNFEDSNGTYVYYYSKNGSLSPLPSSTYYYEQSESKIFNSVHVDDNVTNSENDQSYRFTMTAYAIQSDPFENNASMSPKNVWAMIKPNN